MIPLALALTAAVVAGDRVSLRAVPDRDGARQAILWKGDWLEVRGERKGWLKVYDHRHERPGWIAAGNVRVISLEEAAAPSLRAVVDFLHDTPGQESLGIAYAALYLKVAPKGGVDAALLIELGQMADRLARRNDTAAPEHVDVAESYGLKFASLDRGDATGGPRAGSAGRGGGAMSDAQLIDEGVRLCYDGDAFRQALALSPQPADRATAVLALTDAACQVPVSGATERQAQDTARLALVETVDPTQVPAPRGNALRIRRAEIGAQLVWATAMKGDAAGAAKIGDEALSAFARVDRAELADDDVSAYERAALLVGASRWASLPALENTDKEIRLGVAPGGEPGETCIALKEAKKCTHAHVWASSFRIAPDRKSAALAVQPLPGWLELWVFRKAPDGGWMLDVLAPSTEGPDLGYVELAGWTPDGARMLVVREVRDEGTTHRSFQIVKLGTLAVEKEGTSASLFKRWASADWKARTVAVR